MNKRINEFVQRGDTKLIGQYKVTGAGGSRKYLDKDKLAEKLGIERGKLDVMIEECQGVNEYRYPRVTKVG